jgi:hypothetical protein
MSHDTVWLDLLSPLAKLTAAAGLFGYLLHRGGLRAAAVSAVTLAHVLAFFCVMPISAEFVLAVTITLGTCSYAVLVVERFWVRAGVVVACFALFGALCYQASPALFMVAIALLALWTWFLVTIRGWARKRPIQARSLSTAVSDEL